MQAVLGRQKGGEGGHGPDRSFRKPWKLGMRVLALRKQNN